MSLQSTYEKFLATANPSLLAEDAALHYVTTLTSLHGAAEIDKHLKSQGRDLKKKEEKILDVVEAANALVVEVHTTLEFLTGGGAYLPSLDDNFLADHVATFPIIHIVSFNPDGKISQIRQNWDQGSLLKLIDVIGKTGRNWPIRDGKDQIKLIVSSVKSAGKSTVADEPERRSRGNSNHVTGDPHASLSLFGPRDRNPATNQEPVVAQRSSNSRPPPREYGELFVNGDSLSPPARDGARDRSESPAKFAKAGANKNYAPSRIFDRDEDERQDTVEPLTGSGQQGNRNFYKPNPKRYEHFDMTDRNVEEDPSTHKPLKEVHAKHGSQWNFDDFTTPQKVVPSKVLRTNEVRHWGNNSDEEAANSPVKVKKVDKPRKDAETHFEFIDDGTPDGARRAPGRPRGAGQNSGLGLYKNNLYDDGEGGTAGGEEFNKSNTLANVKDRKKDFDPHFAMADNSPATTRPAAGITDNKAKAVKMMDANWGSYDQSPRQKENMPPNAQGKGPLSETINKNVGINIAGNGMGGKKGSGPSWSFEDEAPPAKKGINTAGDGMGGKKGGGRTWGFGDESDEEVVPKFKTGKTQGKPKATGGDFWDF